MNIIKQLKEVVYQAQKRIDIDAAQNPELQRAIHIVETFLRKSARICYGGQAINAQLAKNDQFYNMETSLPDYDFFSPDLSDADTLIDNLKAAGYTEISKRIGIHEGTTKIYVNYMPIADITLINADFYKQIHMRSVIVDGIHYTDPLFLRMLMFLELSRPRGMVARWEKVYERLVLLDRAHPLKVCTDITTLESREAAAARPAILRFIIKNRRVFMGTDAHAMYKSGGPGRSAKSRTNFLLNGRAPLVFLSPDAELDSNLLAVKLRAKKEPITGYQGTLPAMVALYHDNKLVCLLVQQEACHSFITIPLTKQRQLRLASLDTLLTFFIGLYYRDEPYLMSPESLLCWIRNYIDLSVRYRNKPTKLVPAFPIECSGYETTFASLLRAKGARIEAARQRVGSGERVGSGKTRRNMNSRIRQTRKLY